MITIEEYRKLKSRPKSKVGWRTIAGKRYHFRSSWEANYARYLQFCQENNLIKSWEYEPQTFWFEKIKRGTRSYLPDFKIHTEEGHHWIEVKGYMDSKSKTKLKRFAKYYPEEKIKVISSNWFTINRPVLSNLLSWE